MEYFVGTLAVAVLGAVFAFAREQIKNAREDVEFYRKQLLPLIEQQQQILEKIVEYTREARSRDEY